MSTYSHEDLFLKVQESLEELFEIDRSKVVLDAHLVDDLGLDSIDAIDLAVKLQQITGKKLGPEQFKSVRTVGDMVAAVEALLAE